MSMLSAQCDELRQMAESVGLAMPQAATLMMEAADTIDSLDLALDSKRIAERRVTELLDENAKLRSELESVGTASYLYGRDYLKAENAKLRELVRDYEHCSMHADCDSCKYDGTTSTHCPFSPCFPDIDELRELGIEVDDG